VGQGVLYRRPHHVTSGSDLARDRDGRRQDPDSEGGARHGIAAPRGLSAGPGSPSGRFTRMFPLLQRHDPGLDAIDVLVDRLRGSSKLPEIQTEIPAGFTYLGQFVDHDITYDATSKIERDNDPDALVNFRTPRLDLDSLYGAGPAVEPCLYDWTPGPFA